VLFVSARNLVKHATRCVTKARVASHHIIYIYIIYQPPDTTIINNNNRYNVICVYTCGGYLYYIIIIILCTYIIRAIAYNRRRTGTCYPRPVRRRRPLSLGEGGRTKNDSRGRHESRAARGPARRRRRTGGRHPLVSRVFAHTSTGRRKKIVFIIVVIVIVINIIFIFFFSSLFYVRVKLETASGRESMCVRRCHLHRLSVDFSALPDKSNNIIIDFVTVLCTRLLFRRLARAAYSV